MYVLPSFSEINRNYKLFDFTSSITSARLFLNLEMSLLLSHLPFVAA